jgi:hypothetical protein
MKEWMRKGIDELAAEYGTVPPPWTIYREHPYSMRWRMGSGEAHLELWWNWWAQENFTEDRKIEYFRRFPPHCWLAFLIEAIWEIDVSSEKENLAPYFERTNALGFGSRADYEQDLDDPKWRQSN